MQHLKTGLSFLLISAGIVTSAHAQPMPLPNNPAQEILLQQQRERELREQMDSTANVRTPEQLQVMPAQMRIPAESPCFEIERIELTGELSEKFRFALSAADDGPEGKDPATGRCLGTEGM